MRKKETILDILTLHRKGLKQRAIAMRLCISLNTVKQYIENQELVFTPEKHRQRKSQLDLFYDNIEAWLNEDDYTATGFMSGWSTWALPAATRSSNERFINSRASVKNWPAWDSKRNQVTRRKSILPSSRLTCHREY